MENQLNISPVSEEQPARQNDERSWCYTEKHNKHITHHTLTIKGKRLTHTTEIKERARAMKSRKDINLENVVSVNTFYGMSRNFVAVVILALFTIAFVGAALCGRIESGEFGVLSIVCLVCAIIFFVLAIIVSRKVKPTFFLEIKTVYRGTIQDHSVSYGNVVEEKSGLAQQLIKFVIGLVLLPLTILYLVIKSIFSGKAKHVFAMDHKTGMDIVNTIGDYIIKD